MVSPVSRLQILTLDLAIYWYIIVANKLFSRKRIYHRSPILMEKFQPEGKWIMPESRFSAFPALSVDLLTTGMGFSVCIRDR